MFGKPLSRKLSYFIYSDYYLLVFFCFVPLFEISLPKIYQHIVKIFLITCKTVICYSELSNIYRDTLSLQSYPLEHLDSLKVLHNYKCASDGRLQ